MTVALNRWWSLHRQRRNIKPIFNGYRWRTNTCKRQYPRNILPNRQTVANKETDYLSEQFDRSGDSRNKNAAECIDCLTTLAYSTFVASGIMYSRVEHCRREMIYHCSNYYDGRGTVTNVELQSKLSIFFVYFRYFGIICIFCIFLRKII